MTVAALWAGIAASVRMWKAAGLLAGISLMGFTNANYGIFYVLNEIDQPVSLFGTPWESFVLWLQQLSAIVIPVFALLTWWEMYRDRQRARARQP